MSITAIIIIQGLGLYVLIQTFQLMNSFEVMIICLLDGCISKKIPTDIKNKAGGGWPIDQPSTSLSIRLQDLQGGAKIFKVDA